MKIEETLKTSIQALKLNKVRSFLTMLGIIIGVFSVVMLVSLVRGVQNYITDQFNSIGTNIVFIMPGRAAFGQDPARNFTDNKLSEDQLDAIENIGRKRISAITPFISIGKEASYKSTKYYSMVSGVYAEYNKVFNVELSSGEFFTKSDQVSTKKVAILGSDVKNKLFGLRNPIGLELKVDSISFTVVGVANSKGPDFDEQIIIPYETMKKYLKVDQITYIAVKLDKNENVELASKDIEFALFSKLDEGDFTVMTQSQLLTQFQSILALLSLGLAAIAAISLIVGGIGTMNIMLVSVTERVSEIGLRKALGATPANIASQFLIESILLSLSGGIIGLILGFGGSLAARYFIDAQVPWWTVLVSLTFSVLVGVVFGTYPAIEAAKKNPIESLRYE